MYITIYSNIFLRVFFSLISNVICDNILASLTKHTSCYTALRY